MYNYDPQEWNEKLASFMGYVKEDIKEPEGSFEVLYYTKVGLPVLLVSDWRPDKDYNQVVEILFMIARDHDARINIIIEPGCPQEPIIAMYDAACRTVQQLTNG